jgi:hypothetical protein
MSLNESKRVYISDIQDFGDRTRGMLGLSKSSVVTMNTGEKKGIVGKKAEKTVFDAVSKTNSAGESIIMPTDFRSVGIEIMIELGVTGKVQAQMFDSFMLLKHEVRESYVIQWDAVDKNDPVLVKNFVDAMVSAFS